MNQNKIYKKFQNNFDYNKSLLKPEHKQYYNELQSLSTEHGRLKHEISKTTSSKQQKESLNL